MKNEDTGNNAHLHTIDEEIRLGVIELLQEAKHIGNKELREQVYSAWALSLAKHGYKRIEDMPAKSSESDSALLKNGTLADQVRSVTRLAVAFARDMEEHLALFNVEMDKVIAASLCSSLDEAEFQSVMQSNKDKLRHSAIGTIAHRVNMAFWNIAEHEGYLEGAKTYALSPAKTPLTMWEKGRVEVDETIRRGVIESLPEAAIIENEELRERVYDAWAFSLSKSNFRRIIADEATRFFKVWVRPHRAGTQIFQVFIRFPYYPAVIFPMHSILRSRQPKAFPQTAFSDKIVEVICPFISSVRHLLRLYIAPISRQLSFGGDGGFKGIEQIPEILKLHNACTCGGVYPCIDAHLQRRR
jgi:hypothetical protein